MKAWKLSMVWICLIAGSWSLGGCTVKEADHLPQTQGNAAAYLTVTDDIGRIVRLPAKPKRVVVLSTSLVDLYYGVGGVAVGRSGTATTVLPPEARNLPDVGRVGNVEKLLEMQADCVIGFQGSSEALIPLLESSKIPIIITRLRSYEDVQNKMKLFGEIAGTQELAQQRVRELDQRIANTVSRLPTESKRVVILYATNERVSVELDTTIAGSIAKILRLHNIAAGSKGMDAMPHITPYSLEKLVESDPDIIFVTTMGDKEKIERRIRTDVESNPAWKHLRAVKTQQVFFLPVELFMLNPGIHFDEAVAYMAKLVYPEVYGTSQP